MMAYILVCGVLHIVLVSESTFIIQIIWGKGGGGGDCLSQYTNDPTTTLAVRKVTPVGLLTAVTNRNYITNKNPF